MCFPCHTVDSAVFCTASAPQSGLTHQLPPGFIPAPLLAPYPSGDVVAHATIAAAAAAACASSRERIVAPLRCSGKAGQQQGAQEREQQPPMVIHVNSSCTYPLTMATMFNDGGKGRPGNEPS